MLYLPALPDVLPACPPTRCPTRLPYPMFYPPLYPMSFRLLYHLPYAPALRACLLCLPLVVACCPLTAPEVTLTSFKISFGLLVTVTFTVIGIHSCILSLLNVLSL